MHMEEGRCGLPPCLTSGKSTSFFCPLLHGLVAFATPPFLYHAFIDLNLILILGPTLAALQTFSNPLGKLAYEGKSPSSSSDELPHIATRLMRPPSPWPFYHRNLSTIPLSLTWQGSILSPWLQTKLMKSSLHRKTKQKW